MTAQQDLIDAAERIRRRRVRAAWEVILQFDDDGLAQDIAKRRLLHLQGPQQKETIHHDHDPST